MSQKSFDEINQRMDALCREYGRTPRGDPRRTEIADELRELVNQIKELISEQDI